MFRIDFKSFIVLNFKNIIHIAGLTLSLSSATFAITFPPGCEVSGFAFHDGYLVLNDSRRQTLFMIQNNANTELKLEHVETDPKVFMSPKLESKLNANQWSAFASDIPGFYFKCAIVQPDGHLQPVRCESYLNVCQYPRAKFPLSNNGNYWVSTNKVSTQVIEETTKKGIYLKW